MSLPEKVASVDPAYFHPNLPETFTPIESLVDYRSAVQAYLSFPGTLGDSLNSKVFLALDVFHDRSREDNDARTSIIIEEIFTRKIPLQPETTEAKRALELFLPELLSDDPEHQIETLLKNPNTVQLCSLGAILTESIALRDTPIAPLLRYEERFHSLALQASDLSSTSRPLWKRLVKHIVLALPEDALDTDPVLLGLFHPEPKVQKLMTKTLSEIVSERDTTWDLLRSICKKIPLLRPSEDSAAVALDALAHVYTRGQEIQKTPEALDALLQFISATAIRLIPDGATPLESIHVWRILKIARTVGNSEHIFTPSDALRRNLAELLKYSTRETLASNVADAVKTHEFSETQNTFIFLLEYAPFSLGLKDEKSFHHAPLWIPFLIRCYEEHARIRYGDALAKLAHALTGDHPASIARTFLLHAPDIHKYPRPEGFNMYDYQNAADSLIQIAETNIRSFLSGIEDASQNQIEMFFGQSEIRDYLSQSLIKIGTDQMFHDAIRKRYTVALWHAGIKNIHILSVLDRLALDTSELGYESTRTILNSTAQRRKTKPGIYTESLPTLESHLVSHILRHPPGDSNRYEYIKRLYEARILNDPSSVWQVLHHLSTNYGWDSVVTIKKSKPELFYFYLSLWADVLL
ncbi:MAG: hypothetical protein AAB508_00040, partial [Patescibacteria group bacterium]